MYTAWRAALTIVPAAIAVRAGVTLQGWMWLVLLFNAFIQGMLMIEYVNRKIHDAIHHHNQGGAQKFFTILEGELSKAQERLKQVKNHDQSNSAGIGAKQEEQQKDNLPGKVPITFIKRDIRKVARRHVTAHIDAKKADTTTDEVPDID